MMASGLTPPFKAPRGRVDGKCGVAYPGGARFAFLESDGDRDDNLRTSPSIGVARAGRRALRARVAGARSASARLRPVRGLRSTRGGGRRRDSLHAVRAAASLVRGRREATSYAADDRDRGGGRSRRCCERRCARRYVALVFERRGSAAASAGAARCTSVRSPGARPARTRRGLLAFVHLPVELARIDWPRSAGVCARPLPPRPPLQESM
jgi:hypothetical protein